MRVKLFTLRYSSTLGGFDDTPLLDYVRDKEVLSFREHFFLVADVPHVMCIVTCQEAIANDKQRLQIALREIEAVLATTLHLTLKDKATLLTPIGQGLPFLGWRIYRGVVRLRPANWRRTRQHRQWQHRIGLIDEERLAACVRLVVAHLEHGRTRSLRPLPARRQHQSCHLNGLRTDRHAQPPLPRSTAPAPSGR